MQGRHYTQLEREGDRLVAQGAFEQARQAYAAALDLRPSASWIATKLARLEMPVVAQAAPTRLNLFVHAPPSPDPRCATALRHCLEGHVASGLFARIVVLEADPAPGPPWPQGVRSVTGSQPPTCLDWIRAAERLCPGEIAILARADIRFDASITRLVRLFRKDPQAFVALGHFDLCADQPVAPANPHWVQSIWAFVPGEGIAPGLAERAQIALASPFSGPRLTYAFWLEGHQLYNPFPFVRATRVLPPVPGASDLDDPVSGGMVLLHPGETPEDPAHPELALLRADGQPLPVAGPPMATQSSRFTIRHRMTRLGRAMGQAWAPAAPAGPRPVISYCIPLMGRMADLQGTLAENLASHAGLEGVVEFLIVLFGPGDETMGWITANHAAQIDSGLLRVVQDDTTLDSWHFAKAKNAFRPHLRGLVYSSLDADNFVTLSETETLLRLQDQHEGYFLFHHFSGQWGDGTSGRVSLSAAIYREIGYDAALLARQFDEIDFMLRVLQRHPQMPLVCMDETRNFLTLSAQAGQFLRDEGLTPRLITAPASQRRAPLNPRGADYVQHSPFIRVMGDFNAALSGYRASTAPETRAAYLAKAHVERRKLIDVMPAELLMDNFFHKTNRPDPGQLPPDEVALFVCVKDEGHFLPAFLAHYRRQGVRHFLVVDDGSANPVDTWIEAPDVHVFHPKVAEFRSAKTLWIEALMKTHLAEGAWALCVDADEFIDLPPGMDGFSDLARHLQHQGHEFAPGLMIDMLPDPGTPSEALDVAETDFERLFSYCGKLPGPPAPDYAAHHSIRWGFGPHLQIAWQVDVRYHAFGTFDSLRKIPFLRHRAGRHLNQGFHSLHHTDGSRDPGHEIWEMRPVLPVRHYKLLRLYSAEERTRMLREAGQYHQRTSENITRIFADDQGLAALARLGPQLVPLADFLDQPLFRCDPSAG